MRMAKVGRRGFLGALAGAPIVAQHIGDVSANMVGAPSELSLSQSGAAISGVLGGAGGYYPSEDRAALVRRVVGDKSLLALARQHARERCGVPYSFDTDLAANRSMSQAAKTIIQRERNVEREYRKYLQENDPAWYKLARLGLGRLVG
jgi:hypothetical protein